MLQMMKEGFEMNHNQQDLHEEWSNSTDQVLQVKQHLLSNKNSSQLANIFQSFSDPTRLRIIHALIMNEMCVCNLAATLEMTQSAVSHQLRKLKENHIVVCRKEGRTVYYRLHDDHVVKLFQTGLEHLLYSSDSE